MPSKKRAFSLSLAVVAALSAVAILTACTPSFDLSGKDRCVSDSDCNPGKVCQPGDEGALGTCALSGPSTPDCNLNDLDNDGASSLEGCEAFDCDDDDPSRAPGLPELCDGFDNDCDSFIDEGVVNVCGACEPQPAETCNDRDSDCDGTPDDGVTNACGGCGPPPVDFCDLSDNDCDGVVDEGIDTDCSCQDGEERPCPAEQTRVCAAGTQSCVDGRWGACDGLILSQPEACDGLDNDCDDDIDEAFDLDTDTSHCGQCGVRCGTFNARSDCLGGECVLDCAAGFINLDGRSDNGCETFCPSPELSETCDDGLDNNCDGRIDEGCQQEVLSGQFAFFNIFARNLTGLPAGLTVANMSATFDGENSATFDRLRSSPRVSGGQRFGEDAQVTRTLLISEGQIDVAAKGQSDALGGRLVGAIAPSRHIAALVEVNADGEQVASFALLMRKISQAAPATNLLVRGQYRLALMTPDQNLFDAPGFDAALVMATSMHPVFPQGEGRHTQTTGVGAATTLQDPFGFVVGRGGTLDMNPLAASEASGLVGFVAERGDIAVIRAGQRSAPTIDQAVLGLLIERRHQPPRFPSAGQWTLVGIQTAATSEPRELRYNVVNERLRFEATDSPTRHSIFDGETSSSVGQIETKSDGSEDLIELDVGISDNLQPPRLTLRGHLDDRGEVLVLWEVDESSPDEIQTSIFLAIKAP